MQNIPLLRRSAFAQCTSTMAELGKNPERILSAAGIRMWHQGAPEDFVPLEAFLEAMETFAANLGDEHFGITVAEMNPMRFGAIGQAITRSISLYSALRTSVRLVNKLNTSASMWLEEGVDTIWFCRAPTHNDLLEQFVLEHSTALVQMAAGDGWKPLNVRLTATDAHGLNRKPTFQDAVIRTSQPCMAIAVPKSLLANDIHAGVTGINSPFPERRSPVSLPPDDFVGSFRKIIESAMTDRHLTIDNACEIVGVPKRTLQRHLAGDGLTYRDLVSQVRYRRACELLVHSDMTVREIGHALSYSKDAHFIRAFKHWAGITPGEFRRYRQRSSSLYRH